MENVDNLARNEVMRLPPGFRFHPTDEELILQYLRRKVFSCPLPSSIIPEIDHLYNYDPWDLPGLYFSARAHLIKQSASHQGYVCVEQSIKAQ